MLSLSPSMLQVSPRVVSFLHLHNTICSTAHYSSLTSKGSHQPSEHTFHFHFLPPCSLYFAASPGILCVRKDFYYYFFATNPAADEELSSPWTEIKSEGRRLLAIFTFRSMAVECDSDFNLAGYWSLWISSR